MAASTLLDDRAFERLYARYGRDVYRYVLSVLRNPSDAEDVTQTTFLNAYRAIRNGERPERPQNWLIAIAHNVCRSRIRLRMRRPREVPFDESLAEMPEPQGERPNLRELTRALRRLPSNQRAAITMRELEGRSYPEIAESLGVTVPAVEALLTRARRTLRAQAAVLRGLAVFQLPRSLRALFEHPEVATVTRAAAVVAAVAGGIGYVASDTASRAPHHVPAVHLQPQDYAVLPVPSRPGAPVRVQRHALARPDTAPPAAPARAAAVPDPVGQTAPAAPPVARPEPTAAPPPPPAQTVQVATTAAVATLPVAVPTVPELPVVTVPAPPKLPDPPPLPKLP